MAAARQEGEALIAGEVVSGCRVSLLGLARFGLLWEVAVSRQSRRKIVSHQDLPLNINRCNSAASLFDFLIPPPPFPAPGDVYCFFKL